MVPKPWENAEGYYDPTAYHAVKKITDAEYKAAEETAKTLIKVIKFIVSQSGFDLRARIELRDKKTGRLFR